MTSRSCRRVPRHGSGRWTDPVTLRRRIEEWKRKKGWTSSSKYQGVSSYRDLGRGSVWCGHRNGLLSWVDGEERVVVGRRWGSLGGCVGESQPGQDTVCE